MKPIKTAWFDVTFPFYGFRILIWKRSMGWRPYLHKDAWGAIGWRIWTCGPLWLEWQKGEITFE